MRSEFILAFNEICEERGLAKDVVFEALKTALVSAYKRNVNINTQDVRVEIDQRTGEPTIYAEKEVVESIIDERTEVLMEEAIRQGFTDAELGETVMVESTPRNFGRIAAQTAKQVILQRVREAEREQLFDEYAGREGEIINGTIQSVGGQHITIGLDRTEAIMPRSQQVRTERYRPHDKIRVYLLEVRRTNRGPQIVVSRNHRNLLRRLLELEVPEIYNGQVDIKSIAREAGARSKVAVVALQEGVDPVGACVGMRGVRIQSIVRELNDEKIDIIEWDPDPHVFIAKALSPARVAQVHLDDHPDQGKTAIVIVPDDQLSLAIGREGQNARLAAKLTGWRIDIQSLTESAAESLALLNNPAVDARIAADVDVREKVQQILAKKEAERPITAEDYMVLDRFAAGVLGRVIDARAAGYEGIRKERAEARKRVPAIAWEMELEELNLPLRTHNLLLENEIDNVGEVLYRLELGEEHLIRIEGFNDRSLEAVHNRVAELMEAMPALTGAEPAVVVGDEELVAAEEGEAIAPVEQPADEAILEEVEAELVAEAEESPVGEPEADREPVGDEAEELVEEEIEIPAIDDLSAPLVEIVRKDDRKREEKKGKVVIVSRTGADDEADPDEDEATRQRRSRQLVFDEEAGRVVAKRKRKKSRRRPEWEELSDLDAGDDAE